MKTLLIACLLFCGCASLKGITISGSASSTSGTVTVTANGQPYTVSVGNQTACVSAPGFVPFDGVGISCQTACGSISGQSLILTCCPTSAVVNGSCTVATLPITFAL